MLRKLSILAVAFELIATILLPVGARAATLQGSVLDLQRGGSTLLDDGDLHVRTDSNMWFDAPIMATASNAFSVGGALQFRNTGSRLFTGSQMYDNGQLHIQGTGGVVYIDNPTQVGGALGSAGGLTVSSGGATITGNSTITGTLSGLTGLTVASGGASITGAVTLAGNVRQGTGGKESFNSGGVNTLGTATATTADLLTNRIILHSAAASDTITTPTAAALVAAMPATAAVGDTFTFLLSNSAAANTATLAGGTGVTVSGPAVVAAVTSRVFYCRATNVTASAEAITCY